MSSVRRQPSVSASAVRLRDRSTSAIRLRRDISRLLHVAESLLEERQDVSVIEGVKDHPAVASRTHDPGASEQPQLMRDCGFGHAEARGQVSDAQFTMREGVEDAKSSRVTKDTEDFGETFERGRVKGRHI